MRENMLKNRVVIVGIVVLALSSFSMLATDIGGSLSGTLTSAGNPYIVISDLTVPSGDSLTIGEGVEIRFNNGLKMTANGPLYVNGTSSAPVVFTNNETDGRWDRILVRNSAQIENAVFSHANYEAVNAIEAPISVNNSTFEHNGTGIEAQNCLSSPANIAGCSFVENSGFGIRMIHADPSSSISNCTFDQNGGPIFLDDAYPSISNITINQNHTSANGIGIEMFAHSGTLYNTGYPYIGNLVLDEGCLTIDKGVVLKVFDFEANGEDVSLIVQGTAAEPVIITTWPDDEVGGDTNCDGPSSGTENPKCMHFDQAISVSMDHTIIKYGGDFNCGGAAGNANINITNSTIENNDNDGGALTIYKNSANISNTVFRNNVVGLVISSNIPGSVVSGCDFINNSQYGVIFDGGDSDFIVMNCDFSGNGTAVYFDATSTANLGSTASGGGYNQFACNGIDVENLNATALPAENNWWGEAPPDTSKIVGIVDYEPYLAGPVREILTDVLLTPSGISDILLSWPDLTNGCGYRIYRSALPNQDFIDVSGALSTASYTDPGAISIPGILFYKVEIE